MATQTPKDLLLARKLEPEAIHRLLSPYGFADPLKADANLQAVADEPRVRELLADLIEELLFCVGGSADPDLSLTYLERFAQAAGSKVQLLSFLKATPRTLEVLARTFGASPFMGDILIGDPVYLYWIGDPEVLDGRRSRLQLEQDLARELRMLRTESLKLDVLRTFKRKELLHIGVRDLLRLCPVEETLTALTLLAEVLIREAFEISHEALLEELLLARDDPRVRRLRSEFTVLGMGKLGGGELNFSSDVDLIYVYATETGRLPLRDRRGFVSKDAYFTKLSRRLTAALSEMTNEGQVYRVDLRLRPEGRVGAIAQPARAVREYCRERGRTWERLAYHKARPVAGDRRLGERLLAQIRPFVYGRELDPQGQGDIRQIKDQIDHDVSVRGQRHENVKLGFGGIREIELIAQSLQVAFAKRRPALRERSTLRALVELHRTRLLTKRELETLRTAYTFLRDLENKLQMFSDAQTHSLPSGDAKLRCLARSLGYRDGTQSASEAFRSDYRVHTEAVNVILKSVLYSQAAPPRLSAHPGSRSRPRRSAR